MTFLTFEAANIVYRNAIHFTALYIIMKFLINAVELVPGAITGIKINLGFAVAVDTPAHAQIAELVNFIHILHRAMAGLTLYLARIYVLCMIKINVVRKVVNFYPFYWFRF